MSAATKYLGVSQPISTAQPEEIDTNLTKDLVACLETKNLFENEAEMQKRIDVLLKLTTMVKSFVKEMTRQKLSQHDGDDHDYGGKLFTFGSYRLGVHNRGADIDTLCVVPRHVGREDFFGTFYNMLAGDPEVTELHGVEDAFVPVIKLCYCGIELDILFARLALKEIPDDQSLLDDTLLKNLDDKSVRSLNGSRVAHEILNLIPDQGTYVVVLRAIKFWATTHGVYSNVLGYFGGITWAILTARICQLYPNAAPAKLLQKFFYVFKQWQWPSPVFLKDSDNNRQENNAALKDMVWDPRIRASDRLHLMPIITPAYPEQNSTYNVTNSTKKIIVTELEDASQIAEEVFLGKVTWDKLFEEVNFFTKYKHYVAVLCCAKDSTDHLNYVGFIESKLRHLIANLERHEAVLCAQVNTKQYKPINMDRFPEIGYENPVSNLWFIGLDLDVNLAKTLDLTAEITQFMSQVQNQQTTARRYNDQQKIDVKYVAQKDIKFYLERNDFLQGRRYVKRKPVLSRTASEAEASPLPVAQDAKNNSEEENTAMDTNAENIDKEKVLEGEDKTEKPVFSFGAETTVYPDFTEAKMEVDTPSKPVNVLQENLNSLPKIEISDEDLKSLKRPMEDEPLVEAPPEKQPRPDVTVA